MKFKRIPFFFLVIPIFSFSQSIEKNTTLNCIANWKKGEEKILHISRKKESYEANNLKSTFNLNYEAYISILDSSKDEYMVQWVFHLPSEIKKANPELAQALVVYEGLKMLFTTTGVGSFKELLNWEEVRDTYVAMMNQSLPKNMDDTLKKSVNKAKELFSSKEMVEAALIKEIQLYYGPYGGSFSSIGITDNTSLSNPFGGEPMPAITLQKIVEVNNQQKFFKASINQQIDKKGVANMIQEMFKKMDIPADSSIIKAKEFLANFEITDFNEFLISQATGWIIEMNHQRTGATPAMKQVESFSFKIE